MCRVRVSRGQDYEFSHNAAFDRLLKDGCEPLDIYHAVCTQARPPHPSPLVTDSQFATFAWLAAEQLLFLPSLCSNSFQGVSPKIHLHHNFQSM